MQIFSHSSLPHESWPHFVSLIQQTTESMNPEWIIGTREFALAKWTVLFQSDTVKSYF